MNNKQKRTALAAVGLFCVMALSFSFYAFRDAAVPTLSEISGLPTVILDPGHGGLDGGATVGETVEKDINLSIALTLRDIFEVNGFEVVMTRDTDISIHDETASTTREKKTSDLHNRLAMMNEYPNAVFISIHQNKFGDSSSHGTQIFYGPNHDNSEILAERLQTSFVRSLQPENHRQHKEAGKNLYLMYEAECPAVLVECGFLSNSAELEQLCDEGYQAQIAFTTFCGVMDYLGMDEPMDQPGTTVTVSMDIAWCTCHPDAACGGTCADCNCDPTQCNCPADASCSGKCADCQCPSSTASASLV